MRLAVSRVFRASSAVLVSVMLPMAVFGYSVLSHEALVDALWDVKLKPVLLARFPNSTREALKNAHGYAYGGAIIQDLGYYPHAKKEFSDLTHYVRTGDFILALISEAQNLNELAFALGALSHYMADLDGHRYAVNVGEPILYPRLQRKYGNYVTYEDSPADHLKTEFGFDVLEVAKGNFAPEAYHDFIGFYIAKDLLQRAFRDTYGLELKDVFTDFDRAAESYRRGASKAIPKATRVAWASREDEIRKLQPGITREKFVYTISRSSYERHWGGRYDTPSKGERMLGAILKIIPPIGPLRALRFKMPTSDVEDLFMKSFDRSAAQYRATLDALGHSELNLPNKNYDVGAMTRPGEYRLEDDVRAFWLHMLAKKGFVTVTPPIRAELAGYYSNLNAPIHTKVNRNQWKQLLADLQELNAGQANTTAGHARAGNKSSGY
jgi:zinc dependent phospholipase C